MNLDDTMTLIDGWTHETRLEILAALINTSIACVQLDKTTNTWCLTICGKVPAKMRGAIVTHSPIRLTSSKMVILEPSFEKIEDETVTETICATLQTTKMWWGSKTVVIEPQKTIHKVIEHKSIITVPRSIWRLHNIFFGADCAMPFSAPVSGDLFGPDSDARFGASVEPSLDVTLMIENTTEQEMPFYAVILGIRQQDANKHRWSSSERT